MTELRIQPLTPQAFQEFGDVISCNPDKRRLINNNRTERYHDLAQINLSPPNPQTLISIFKGQPISSQPYALELLERHPLGSQAFIPINNQPYFVVVAPAINPLEPDTNRIIAFFVDGHTGINYFANTWHHPLLPITSDSLFTVVDRGGEGNNLETFSLVDSNITLDPTPFFCKHYVAL